MANSVCVAAREREIYCQTFIRAHIKRLPAQVMPLYLAELPPSREVAIEGFLAANNIDVVLAEFGNTGVEVMGACYKANVPLVVRFAGEDAYCESDKWQRLRKFYLPLFTTAAKIVAVSHDMESQLHMLGAPHDKICYCPSGADESLFGGGAPAHFGPIFSAVGRFVDKKAPCLTLVAFEKVVSVCPEARLVMVGTGYLLDACKRLARALHIDHAVEFRGICSHEEVAAIMRTSRCFVQHSVRADDGNSEGTPNSIMEAGATGLPVVATRHCGITDVVIEGNTGFLVDEGDIDAMADRMLRLAHDPALAARMGKHARQRVLREFSMQRSIDGLWTILTDASRLRLHAGATKRSSA